MREMGKRRNFNLRYAEGRASFFGGTWRLIRNWFWWEVGCMLHDTFGIGRWR